MDYKNGKIYMIYPCVEGADEGDIYIGSTTTLLAKRMAGHRNSFKFHISPCTSSSILFDKYGVENCKIELVIDFPCDSKRELNREEGRRIREQKCVNKLIPGRTRKEYVEDNKERIRKERVEYAKQNATRTKECRSEKVICDCGCELTKYMLPRHQKSQKHLERMAELKSHPIVYDRC